MRKSIIQQDGFKHLIREEQTIRQPNVGGTNACTGISGKQCIAYKNGNCSGIRSAMSKYLGIQVPGCMRTPSVCFVSIKSKPIK